MRRFLLGALGALVVSGAQAAGGHAHWGYEGHQGPAHWSDLDPGFGACALGKMQSPIDIRSAKKADLAKIDFEYAAGPAEVTNNGHTVQVSLPSSGGIEIDGTEYALLQFHFHTPSEERIGGKTFPMVAHFVHKSAEGALAVVAVLIKEGGHNEALAPVFDAMPAEAGKKQALAEPLDPAAILPADRGYYAYMGSLTTPPCSEGVRWRVLKQPIEVSKAQIATFRKLYSMNARPVQPLNEREVLESRP